jgi:hypothetical protein
MGAMANEIPGMQVAPAEVQAAAATYSLWTDAATPAVVSVTDARSTQLGVKFRANSNGVITGLRFYKGAQNTGTHVGNLWTATGTSLGNVTFTNETASGWQTATFTTPVAIQAGTTYVASYLAPSGRWATTNSYFSSAYTNGPLTALANGAGGGNGVFAYNASASTFPTRSGKGTNYWVDVLFQPAASLTASPDQVSATEDTELRIPFATLLANDSSPNGSPLTISAVSAASKGSVSLNTATSEVVFTPSTNVNGAGGFTYAISDNQGGTGSTTVTVNIAPVQDPPVAVADGGFSVPVNGSLVIPVAQLLANDSDPDGDPLSVTGVSNATGGTAVLDAAAGTVTFTPTKDYVGSASFNYAITDGQGNNASATVSATVQSGANRIVLENQKPGSPKSEWDIQGAGSSNIQGFATDMSVAAAGTVNFKINTNSTNYRIDIYRLGYYGGSGARKVDTIQRTLTSAQTQPNPLTDSATGLVDAGNWNVSASWTVPGDAVSGVYVAKLVRQDGVAGASHIPFIVRDDTSRSDLIMQTSDTTWQAYNAWGGNSLYTGSPAGRAYKVSYNRPFLTRGDTTGTSGPRDFLFDSDYPMLRWLEANGYDVSYVSGIDTDRAGAELLEHKGFLSVGHDEYWSGQQRANVEAARDAGVNLAFFSGNEVFWKTRWENSIDTSKQAYRTLVSYKETHANAEIDPSPQWTGTWRDPRFSPPSDGGRPENALTGTIFTVNDSLQQETIKVPGTFGDLRFWRNTSISGMSPSQTATLSGELLSYEWDEDLDNGFRPPGLMDMSSTADNNTSYIQDYGSTYGPGSGTHNLTLYRDDSGALVFGAGTPRWAWGLDETHDYDMAHGGNPGAAVPDVRVQQATANLFADMGVQAGSLQSNLVQPTASTDQSKPTSVIATPSGGATLPVGSGVTISGTATDTGGVVGGVEVSVDGGSSWRKASGRSNWTYAWTPQSSGTATIKSRAVDDSGNLEIPGGGTVVTVGNPQPVSGATIFSASATPGTLTDPDNSAVELGVKFRASANGVISGLRFYKGPQNTGTHVGSLWAASGQRLANVTFANESASGWQQANFSSPVSITSGTTYVASYHAPNGKYSVDENYFATAVTNGPLEALASSTQGGNGVYAYGPAGSFPTSTYNGSNYWVDVVFNSATG